MTTRRPVRSLAICALAALPTALASPAPAQLIAIKTAPVAQGDQFDIFPSENSGMAGLSIAVADPLADPFVNPAKAGRRRGGSFFGSPTFYRVSNQAGGGRTLPLGALFRSDSWYGGLALAVQEVDAARRELPFIEAPGILPHGPVQTQPGFGPRERAHGNRYAFGMLGKLLPERGLSFAGSVLWARLNAVDGVDLLYAGSRGIDQFGGSVDVRLGVLKDWDAERSLEAIFVHNRFGMTHDVTYAERFWDPGQQRIVELPRVEHNVDRTNTWGLHLEYERPLGASAWRIGGLVTGNLLSHPKIPNYEIMSIPRDPGRSHAYNVGVGIANVQGAATIGVDAIYEPVWSHTWADAEAPIETSHGTTIPAGDKTIENHFRFSNALLRVGVTQDLAIGARARAASVQLGMTVRSIRYWLDQYDHVQAFGRSQQERWTEWMPAWGASLRFPDVELRYRGRLTLGTGRPGVAPRDNFALASAAARSTILVAPSGPLTLDEVRVVSHQFSVSLPVR